MELGAGTLVASRYRLQSVLGQGGMGVIWGARDEQVDRPVALKVMSSQSMSEERVARFLREARLASSLRHPNLVGVHDVFTLEDGCPVLVMDLLDGESLRARLTRDGHLPLPDACGILLQVVSAVGSAHARGVIHRDLKPENVFLVAPADAAGNPASVRVLDFGIAKLVDTEDDRALTVTGAVLGTPQYMSPEQAMAERDLDARSDVWSLGVLLYECLTGRLPAEGRTVAHVLKLVAMGELTPIAVYAPSLPVPILDLVNRMLSVKRSERPRDLREVLTALRAYSSVVVPGFEPAAAMTAETGGDTPRGDLAGEASEELLLRAAARVGSVIHDKYRVDSVLGVGGMATVYAATHRNGKRVAVKVLHPEVGLNANIKARFLREGYVANKVDHPGAVVIQDDDVAPDGTTYLVMELLEGETLARCNTRSRFSAEDLLITADAVLDVLEAAHGKGIIHRDLKPQNLFLTRSGTIKVLDFGIAQVREAASSNSGVTTLTSIGTPSFMPPEQARGGPGNSIDPRADLWALGATLFNLASGRLVHEGSSVNEQLLAAMTKSAEKAATVLPDIHPELAALIDRALAFDRDERWTNAQAMRASVRAAYLAITARPLSPMSRVRIVLSSDTPPDSNATLAVTLLAASSEMSRRSSRVASATPASATPPPLAATMTPGSTTPVSVAAMETRGDAVRSAAPGGSGRGSRRTMALIGAVAVATFGIFFVLRGRDLGHAATAGSSTPVDPTTAPPARAMATVRSSGSATAAGDPSEAALTAATSTSAAPSSAPSVGAPPRPAAPARRPSSTPATVAAEPSRLPAAKPGASGASPPAPSIDIFERRH